MMMFTTLQELSYFSEWSLGTFDRSCFSVLLSYAASHILFNVLCVSKCCSAKVCLLLSDSFKIEVTDSF
jgi:hypothetical protein